MTQDLFDILRPRINARVLEIVNEHLSDEQIGLLLVKLINPYAVLSQQEEAKLRGVDRKTLRGMKERGELPASLPGEGGVKGEDAPNRRKAGRHRLKSPHRAKPEGEMM